MTHVTLDDRTLGTHPMVARFLKGMFNARPPAPHSHSWEVNPNLLEVCQTNSLYSNLARR